MGLPRKAKEKSVSNSKKSASSSTSTSSKKSAPRNAKKKKTDCNESETTSNSILNTQKNSSIKFSVFDYIDTLTYANRAKLEMKTFTKLCILRHLEQLSEQKMLIPFERRVTALQWHPTFPKIFAAGSKGGELLFLNLSSGSSSFIPGVGPGGSVVGMKFALDDMCSVYTASITGNVRRESFYNKTGISLLSTDCFQNWFTSLDISSEKRLLIAGDCRGYVRLLNINEEKKESIIIRLHKDKINHIEFCSLDPNMIVTASLDHTVKLWDLRMFGTLPEPLQTFPHVKGVNSAYFSPTNKNALLTTDQHSEIRVYKSPGWSEKVIITHPHRQFQHLTPIKAIWHPYEDIIAVGRYPDDAIKQCDTRTVDFYDGTTGDILQRHKSVSGGIVSLNAFNNFGDCLVSASGRGLAFKGSKDMLNKFPNNIVQS